MFYEIISKEGKKNYLFGTIHFNDKDITNLPLEVKQAFCAAETVVFEANMLDENLAILIVAIQKWQSKFNTDTLPPMYVTQDRFLSGSTSRLTNPLDAQLLHEANQQNKSLIFLESLSSQMEIIIGVDFSYAEQLEYAQFMEKWSSEDMVACYDQLTTLYLKGNPDEVLKYSIEIFENPPEVVQRYFQSFFFDRDISLAKAMRPQLEKGNAFIAVGASHLPGVIKLIQEDYEVRPIALGPRIHPIQGKLKDLSNTKVTEAMANFGSFAAAASSSETTASSSTHGPKI